MPDFSGAHAPLTDDEVCNGAGSEGEMMGRIGGLVRYLAEFTDGECVDGQYPIAPTPPMNRRKPGHDHSGGKFGKAQKHTVWGATFGFTSVAGVSNQQCPLSVVSSIGMERGLPSVGWAYIRGVMIPGGQAYDLVTPEFFLFANGVANYEARCQSSISGVADCVATGSTVADYLTITLPRLRLKPGRLNTFGFRINIIGVSGSTVTVGLLAAALHQAD